MTQWNLAALPKDEQDKVQTDLIAASAAWKMRMHVPVVPEHLARKQPEHLQAYFKERYLVHLENAKKAGLPGPDAPQYTEMAEANKK